MLQIPPKPTPPQVSWFVDEDGYTDHEALDHAELAYESELADWEWSFANPMNHAGRAYDAIDALKEAQIEMLWADHQRRIS